MQVLVKFKASNFDSTSGTSMVNFVFETGWQSISFKVVLSGSTVAPRPCNIIKVKHINANLKEVRNPHLKSNCPKHHVLTNHNAISTSRAQSRAIL